MYWFLFSVIISGAVLEQNFYVLSNGNYIMRSDGTLVNKNDENIKGTLTIIVYKSIDPSQPFAIVSNDRIYVFVVDHNGNIVVIKTKVFINYEKNGRLCSLKKNSKERMCKALSHALDPSDDDGKKEEDEDKDKDKDKADKAQKEGKNDGKDDVKDLESDITEINNMSFSDSFLWTVDIADNEGLQRIINFKTKLCVTVVEGKLEMKACDKTIPGQRWKFRTVKEKPKENNIKTTRKIIKVKKESSPHTHFMRPEDNVILVQPFGGGYQEGTHIVEPGDEILSKRSKKSNKKRKLEDTDDGGSQEVEVNLKNRNKIEGLNQQYVSNLPFTQQNLVGPPLNQQSMLVPQNVPNHLTSFQMLPNSFNMPINYWPKQQQGESVSITTEPTSDKKTIVSVKNGNGNTVKSNNPSEKESESEETSESPEKTNEVKNDQIAMKVVSPMYNDRYFANPMGPYPPFAPYSQMQPAVIVNNTTKTNEESKKKNGGLGGFLGGLAKSSPIGSALGG